MRPGLCSRYNNSWYIIRAWTLCRLFCFGCTLSDAQAGSCSPARYGTMFRPTQLGGNALTSTTNYICMYTCCAMIPVCRTSGSRPYDSAASFVQPKLTTTAFSPSVAQQEPPRQQQEVRERAQKTRGVERGRYQAWEKCRKAAGEPPGMFMAEEVLLVS